MITKAELGFSGSKQVVTFLEIPASQFELSS
jgi:hypothetical protein